MARPSLAEQEIRKSKIANLMVRGESTVVGIRNSLALDGILADTSDDQARRTIEKDILEIKIEWQSTRLADVEEALGRELAKIEEIEKEAWTEYERSKTEGTKTVIKDFSNDAGGASQQNIVETIDRLGNPKYLERICWCIEKRIKLLGLEHVAVTRSTVTLKQEVDTSQLQDDELKRRLDKLLGS